MKENPNYYAVIPARVLFDKHICAEAKILYGQITALCNKEGYCWAGNAYFAGFHGVSDRTVQRWITSLRDSGYISVEFKLIDGTREIETRRIRIAEAEPLNTPSATPNPPIAPPQPDPPPRVPPEVVTILSPPPRQECHQVVTNLSGGGDKIVGDNIININKTTTTTPDTPQPPRERPDPPAAAAADPPIGPEEIRDECLSADPLLVFDPDFYPRAASFMAQNSLDLPYVAWLRSYCETKNPRSLSGLFFKIFFAPNVAALYLAGQEREQNHAAATPPLICPACGHNFDPGQEQCPACRLSAVDARSRDQAALARAGAFLALTAEQKTAYDRELDSLLNAGGSLSDKIARAAQINARYGLPP